MTNPNPITTADAPDESDDASPACVMVFNASDPSGAGGLAADATAIASVGAHALPVVTGAYARDTAEILDHFAFDEEAVTEQARAILEESQERTEAPERTRHESTQTPDPDPDAATAQ